MVSIFAPALVMLILRRVHGALGVPPFLILTIADVHRAFHVQNPGATRILATNHQGQLTVGPDNQPFLQLTQRRIAFVERALLSPGRRLMPVPWSCRNHLCN